MHLAALYYCFFLEGWNDGTIGPLLPVLQRDYRVGFEIVSLLFVTNCIGFVSGAFVNVHLNDRLGFGKVMVIGSLCQLIAYIMQSPAPPFPVMVISYFFAGFGLSFQNAQGNGFVGSLPSPSIKLMMLHASYGFGAFASPLLSTYFSGTRHWSRHFVVSACIAVTNTAILSAVFRGKRQNAGINAEDHAAARRSGPAGQNLYRQIFNIRAVYFMATFALIYIGVEVTVGGWIVTFIIEKRGGGHSAGYISSGFFGGLTIGRLTLMWINKRIGEYTVVFVYTVLAIALEITVWLVPSILQNAIAVSFIGLLLGPMFPLMVSHGSRVIPPSLFTGSMGWITGIGMAGSAALPFITGILASKYGIVTLQPFLIAMMSTMVGMWAMVPRARRVD
ncbi:MFS general substrate transporter [Marasmius fiardii PR-910]|nr:MFS general substrate transporter [Marasmius fiardii PR-910]